MIPRCYVKSIFNRKLRRMHRDPICRRDDTANFLRQNFSYLGIHFVLFFLHFLLFEQGRLYSWPFEFRQRRRFPLGAFLSKKSRRGYLCCRWSSWFCLYYLLPDHSFRWGCSSCYVKCYRRRRHSNQLHRLITCSRTKGGFSKRRYFV